jgi:hypothetical protein
MRTERLLSSHIASRGYARMPPIVVGSGRMRHERKSESNAPCTPARSRPHGRCPAAWTLQRHHRRGRRQSRIFDRHRG